VTSAWRRQAAQFIYAPTNSDWVSVLRLGLGALVVVYCLAWRQDWSYLFAGTGRGLLSRELSERIISAESPLIPRLGWMTAVGARFGLTEQATLSAIWILLLLAALTLTIGLFCRTSAIIVWLLHLCAAKSGGLLSYGLDNFMTIGLFYLMWAPFPDRFAWDARRKSNSTANPQLLGIVRRALQLHLCVVYFFGGATKMLGSGWWDGLNLWRALTREPLNVLSAETVANFAPLLPAAGIAVWLVEIGYPFMIWHHRTRAVWLVLTCGMHLAIGLGMGMHLFGFIMIVLNVAAFGPSRSRRHPPQNAPSAAPAVY
jgi:hypothetical protein